MDLLERLIGYFGGTFQYWGFFFSYIVGVFSDTKVAYLPYLPYLGKGPSAIKRTASLKPASEISVSDVQHMDTLVSKENHPLHGALRAVSQRLTLNSNLGHETCDDSHFSLFSSQMQRRVSPDFSRLQPQ